MKAVSQPPELGYLVRGSAAQLHPGTLAAENQGQAFGHHDKVSKGLPRRLTAWASHLRQVSWVDC